LDGRPAKGNCFAQPRATCSHPSLSGGCCATSSLTFNTESAQRLRQREKLTGLDARANYFPPSAILAPKGLLNRLSGGPMGGGEFWSAPGPGEIMDFSRREFPWRSSATTRLLQYDRPGSGARFKGGRAAALYVGETDGPRSGTGSRLGCAVTLGRAGTARTGIIVRDKPWATAEHYDHGRTGPRNSDQSLADGSPPTARRKPNRGYSRRPSGICPTTIYPASANPKGLMGRNRKRPRLGRVVEFFFCAGSREGAARTTMSALHLLDEHRACRGIDKRPSPLFAPASIPPILRRPPNPRRWTFGK